MTVRTTRARRLAQAAVGVLLLGGLLTVPVAAQAAVPDGFTDEQVIGGLVYPTAAAFAPDGRVYIAEKRGLIKTFDSVEDTTAATAADLQSDVHDYWDRGLLGLTLDPDYPQDPSLYVAYSHDTKPGGGQWNDDCPNPPGATEDGCVIDGQIAKITVDPATGEALGAPQVLLTGWCQQFPSHSVGTVVFGPDGSLYAGGGDGASFNYSDYGQRKNPCADPPGAAGTNLTAPTARGGALRSQSLRRPAGEPAALNGTIVRIDPDTGEAKPGNPYAASADPNKRRVIAYGMRNQFRFAFRPGTDELWVGDVGWNKWEEVNRITGASDTTAENFGWPCYEGGAPQTGYDGLNLDLCESLYAAGGQQAPYYAYDHAAKVVPGETCPSGGSSISGIAFEQDSDYPSAYDGALFFSDSSRNCIWAMQRGANGLPDPDKVVTFVTGVNIPVQLLSGPDGDLYYLALGAGQLRRVTYTSTNRAPTAVATADPSSGPAPLAVRFDGSQSSDPNAGDTLSYAWDLDGDGQYDDSTAVKPERTYLDGELVRVKLRVTDQEGASGTDTVEVTVGDPPAQEPVVAIDTPTTNLRWQVGQEVSFSGRASDAQDGTLPASAMSWRLTLQHCTSPSNCHAHDVRSWNGVDSGTFTAPDHSYPSYLDLRLNATDSDGNSTSQTIRLEPKTVDLQFTSEPSGLALTVGDSSGTTPFTRTVIVGSANSLSADSPQGSNQHFVRWSNGQPRAHEFVAPAEQATFHAEYVGCTVGGQPVAGCGATVPTAAKAVQARAASGSATVTWEPPHWPGLGGVTKYRVAASTGVSEDVPASARSQTFSGLAAGANHTFTVTPFSDAGAGAASTVKLTGTKVSVSATPATITYGQATVVSGTLTRADTGRGLPTKPVLLQGREKGGSTWTTLATGTTSTSGVVSFSRAPSANYEYRLAYGDSTVYGASESPVASVSVRQAITGAFAKSTVRPTELARFTGKVSPDHAGQTVHLQYYSGGKWTTSRSAVLDAGSQYVFEFSKPKGTYTYRAMKYAHSDHAVGYSPTRTLTVK